MKIRVGGRGGTRQRQRAQPAARAARSRAPSTTRGRGASTAGRRDGGGEEPSEEPGAYLEVEEPGAGILLGGHRGRGELEAGGTPRTFDPEKVDIVIEHE
jgi:hypothetical protein